MRFTCESCNAQYMISDEKVGPKGVRVRCKRCGNVVLVTRPPTAAPEPEAPVPAPAPTATAPAAAPDGSPGETTLERELGSAFDSAFGSSGGPGGEGPGAAGAEGLALRGPGGSWAGPASPESSSPGAESPSPAAASFTGGGAAAAGGEDATPSPRADELSDWYVAIEDRQVGPLTAPDVRARWESGEIGPDTLAWRPGMADWRQLSAVPEMAAYLAPAPRPAGAAPASSPLASRDGERAGRCARRQPLLPRPLGGQRRLGIFFPRPRRGRGQGEGEAGRGGERGLPGARHRRWRRSSRPGRAAAGARGLEAERCRGAGRPGRRRAGRAARRAREGSRRR